MERYGQHSCCSKFRMGWKFSRLRKDYDSLEREVPETLFTGNSSFARK